MLWFTLSLLTAFLSATEAALAKRLCGDLPPLAMAAYVLAYSTPLFLVGWALTPLPPLAPGFWYTFLLILPFNLAGTMLYLQAINISPLSLTMPYLAATPLVTMVFGATLLGEFPDIWGLLGILSVVGGSFVLNLDPNRDPSQGFSLLDPLRAVLRERGSLFMLIAALIFGFTSALGKKLILQSSPAYAGAVFPLVHNLVLLTLILGSGKVRPWLLLARPGKGLVIGVCSFLHLFCHFFAISYVAAAYMVSIKRLNGVFAVLYGGLLFKEANFKYRLAGALLMSTGTIFFTLAN